MKLGQEATTPVQWSAFVRKYRGEMARPESSHTLGLLAALSHHTNFSGSGSEKIGSLVLFGHDPTPEDKHAGFLLFGMEAKQVAHLLNRAMEE